MDDPLTLRLLAPFSNALLVLLVPGVCLPRAVRATGWRRWAWLCGPVLAFWALYLVAATNGRAAEWLGALNSPLVPVFLFLVLPALHLPRNRWYRLFLVVPALFLVALVADIVLGYRQIPEGANVTGVLVRPTWFLAGLTSALVLVQPWLSLRWFRRVVRGSLLLVLIYGGFALRQSYADYQSMVQRRGVGQDVMNVSETQPVMRYEDRLVYLPSAPCRFAPDGGYVQGCNLELFQRLLQVDFGRVAALDPGAVNTLSLALASLLTFLAFSFVLARWACGWLCPLSTLGDLLNWGRERCGLPAFRPTPRWKTAHFFSGVGLMTVALGMARAVPSLDEQGKFLGCKLPIYPLCKLCPGQQVCPVVGSGIGAYPPLPGTDWAWGFFRYGCLILLALFLVSFLAARRLWCYFCPMGMISGLFNRGGLVTLRKDAHKCNGCGVCAETCPMDIQTVRDEMGDANVTTYDCVLCLKCVDSCPRDDCLSVEHAGRTILTSRFPRENP